MYNEMKKKKTRKSWLVEKETTWMKTLKKCMKCKRKETKPERWEASIYKWNEQSELIWAGKIKCEEEKKTNEMQNDVVVIIRVFGGKR